MGDDETKVFCFCKHSPLINIKQRFFACHVGKFKIQGLRGEELYE
jgi:hypothetical protein